MPDASDLADDLAEAAAKPQSVSIDGNSVTSRSIDDMAKAIAITEQRAVTDVRQFFMNRTRMISGPRQ